MSMSQKASLAKAGKQWVKYRESADKAIADGNYELSESVLFAALTEAQDVFEATDFRYIYTLEKLAQSLWFLGRFDEALDYCKKLVDIHNLHAAKLEPISRLAYTINLALIYHASKRFIEAERFYTEALNQCATVFGNNHNCTLKIRSLLADLLISTGNVGKAQKLGVAPSALTNNDWLSVETIKAIKSAAQTPNNASAKPQGGTFSLPPSAEGSADQDQSYMPPPPPPREAGDDGPPTSPGGFPQVEEEEDELTAQQKLEPLPDFSHPELEVQPSEEEIAVPLKLTEAVTIFNSNKHTAETNMESGDIEVAHRMYSINLKLLHYFKFDDEQHLETLKNLVTIKQKMGLADQAIEFATELHELKTKIYGADHLDVAHSANELAGVYYSAAMYEKATELTKSSIDIYKKHHGEEHASIASAMHNLATLYHVQRKYGPAEDVYKDCLAMKTKLFGSDHPSTSRLLKSYAELLRETHREEEAEHMSQMATGMITGSWKSVQDVEVKKDTMDPSELCEICNEPKRGFQICPACGYKPRERGTTSFTDLS